MRRARGPVHQHLCHRGLHLTCTLPAPHLNLTLTSPWHGPGPDPDLSPNPAPKPTPGPNPRQACTRLIETAAATWRQEGSRTRTPILTLTLILDPHRDPHPTLIPILTLILTLPLTWRQEEGDYRDDITAICVRLPEMKQEMIATAAAAASSS